MESFRIAVPEEQQADLRERLGRTRLPRATPGEPGAAGVDLGYLRELIEYWSTDFDWRAAESRLNELPQFRARIDGQRVHFVHLRSGAPGALPIILSHGWPYSFIEMTAIAPYLVDPLAHGGGEDDAFDVVIPSLPGYGFSDPLAGVPFTGRAVAGLWHELMTRELGYERYATYGEDVGTTVSDWTAALHPERVIGLFATHAAFPPAERQHDLSAEEIAFRAGLDEKWKGESAYSAQQSTKPDTLAAALNDSPAGLAAWLVEKFRSWSGDDFASSWSTDDILTTVSLYWFTETIGTSFLAYFDDRFEEPLPVVEVPVGVAVQRGERGFPRSYAARSYRDIRQWGELPRGGHFTVKQTPELVAEEMRRFFRPLR